ncbi:MAG: branched-chain alpha-keto acid dehydrogenase subunit E2 [Acidobacteria bacterium]|nr:MAG: branched-chain alpha-keto acid dehydrogenase subunit E2 [Acidobacteriota bacterium]
MPTELKLPNLGENIHSGNVVRVLVAEGDVITEQQPILEIETDKAAIEVPSPQAGKVVKILVKEGQTIDVGAPVIALEERADGKAAPAQKSAAAASAGVQSPPAKAETRAAVKEPPRKEPEPQRKKAAEEQTAERAAPAVPPAPAVSPKPEDGKGAMVAAAPSVRRFAREIGVDVAQVKGTGPSGRISIDDVKNAARSRVSAQQAAAPSIPSPGLPDFTRWGEIHREPFTNIRRATARQMAAAWSTIPQVTQFDKADITELEEMRQRYAEKAQKAGGKLTVTAILMKVVASALRVFPKFNASLDMEKGEIVYKQYIHVGVAVDTPKGLLVPVIRDVERKNVIEISVELAALSEKARSGKLTLEEMQGGSFTVSNLGGIGGTGFSPIVNLPEVAILGVARTAVEPLFIDGGFQPRKMLPLSLSYDHRLIDGADGARFLRWLAEALEQPFLMLLEG